MASSRLGEPSTARSHSLLNAIISASNWSRPRRCSTRPFSYKRLIGSAPHRLAARCRDLLDSYHVRVAPAALVHAIGSLLDHFGCHVAAEVDFEHDIVGVEIVVAAHHGLAPLR